MKIDYALSNSFGFGGTNGALLFKRYEDEALEGRGLKALKASRLKPRSRVQRSMKIAVCIKQVPTREWQPRLNDDKTWIRDQDVSYEMNEPDAYALEEACACARSMAARWWCARPARRACSR